MKRIIYFLSTVLVAALYSCSGQYDNIDLYATDESVYVGKYDDVSPGAIRIGYNRIEVDLTDESMGRVPSDEMYMGKAKRTIIEYEEANVTVRRTIDSVCSWLNITGLTSPKTYIIKIYTEDGHGNKSVAVEALGKPFTDSDLAGISFPVPYMVPSPSSVEFIWPEDGGFASSLYRFVDLEYSYVNNEGDLISDKLTSRDVPRFDVLNLNMGESTPVYIASRIVPIMESGRIIDTLVLRDTIVTTTVSPDEYLATRTLRPITSALINPNPPDESAGTVTLGSIDAAPHVEWTEIKYYKSDGDSVIVRIANNDPETILCTDIKRDAKIKIRCAYVPPGTNIEFTGGWSDGPFFVKRYSPKDENWTVLPNDGYHPWDDQPVQYSDSPNWQWLSGHPMLLLDEYPNSGWHSRLPGGSSKLPQVLIIDMKASNMVSEVMLGSTGGGYWNNISLYLTDDLAISGYETYTIDWGVDKNTRENAYKTWMDSMIGKLPGELPAASWGAPVAQWQAMANASHSFSLPPASKGRFLIIVFPDSANGNGYINAHNIEVYF
jgi:hypothetical protein